MQVFLDYPAGRLWWVDEPRSELARRGARQATATLVQQARAQGVTLVATLHQVDMALAHFSRIVGLRDGQLQFDLPAGEVSRDRLERLYAQKEHELAGDGATPVDDGLRDAPAPVAMHCR